NKHAGSLVSASGSLGIVVPPSIAFIVFAVVAAEFGQISVSRLFIAGIVPGIIMALAFFVAAIFVPRVRELAGLPAKAKTGAGVSVGSTTTGTSTAGSIDADGSVGSAGNSAAGDRTQLLTTNGKCA